MNINKRIENLEKNIKPAGGDWDFSNTSTEQLLTLKRFTEGNRAEAERYTKELIDGGFLSYRGTK